MWKRLGSALLGFLFLATLLLLGYFIITGFTNFFRALDQPLVIAILAASVTILTSTITVVVGRILERKKEIEAHFRQRKYDQYDELLAILYGLFGGGSAEVSEDTVAKLREWQRKLILFAGAKTLRSFVDWMTDLKRGEPTIRTVLLMEEFFKALRADLGVSNFGVRQGDFAHLILRHADLLLVAAKTIRT